MFRLQVGEEDFYRNTEIHSVEVENEVFNLVLEGRYEAVRSKIIKGTSANLRNDNNQTLLHYAILYNQVKIATFLIEAGADLDAKDKFGQTPRDLIQKHDLALYNQPADSISKSLLQKEQENVEKDVLGSLEENSFCSIL